MTTGVDIVDISRIQKIIEKYGDAFLSKIFTGEEREYCESAMNRFERYAGRFAAKEAIRKALQPFTSARHLPFHDMNILPDANGVPVVHIDTGITFTSQFTQIALSISHERDYAIAFVIIQ